MLAKSTDWGHEQANMYCFQNGVFIKGASSLHLKSMSKSSSSYSKRKKYQVSEAGYFGRVSQPVKGTSETL